jgi:hypothetical protein
MTVYNFNLDKMLNQLASNLEIRRPDDYHNESLLVQYINLGMIEVARRVPGIVQATRFMHLSASVARYGLLSANLLRGRIDEVLYLKSGSLSGSQYPLKKVDRRGLNAVTPTATSSVLSSIAYNKPGSGSPTHYLLDGNVLELRPIPTSAHAGANRICLKGPGVPDVMMAGSAIPGIALEHRMLPVLYATYLGQVKDKDPRANDTLAQFRADCAQADADIKWGDQEEPPSMLTEEYFPRAEWGIR